MFLLKEHTMNGTVLMNEHYAGYDFNTFKEAVCSLKEDIDIENIATILKNDEQEFIYRIDGNMFPTFGILRNKPLLIVSEL